MSRMSRRSVVICGGLVCLVLALVFCLWPRSLPPAPPPVLPPKPSLLAIWPWPHAMWDTPHAGVTHWLDSSSPDGTVLDFFDFDLQANPGLRFEIYDQDQDDAHPFDDTADCWPQGVGWATHHLNTSGRGKVIAAWHGLFFNCDPVAGKSADPRSLYVGHHVTPVVIDGQVHCNVGQARWTFGVQYDRCGRATFKTLLMPDKTTLAKSFTFASGGAQCLVKDGQPQKLRSFAAAQEPFDHHSTTCASDEAGYIPNVDWIQTTRATVGWSLDQKHFYLLFVKQTGTEGGAVMASHGHGPPTGGWTISDEQRFWLAKGVWGAINSDGGDVGQLTFLRPDGNYLLLPPIAQERRVYPPNFPNAPAAGTLLYFYVRDIGRLRAAPR
jgi:hypothetical protein